MATEHRWRRDAKQRTSKNVLSNAWRTVEKWLQHSTVSSWKWVFHTSPTYTNVSCCLKESPHLDHSKAAFTVSNTTLFCFQILNPLNRREFIHLHDLRLLGHAVERDLPVPRWSICKSSRVVGLREDKLVAKNKWKRGGTKGSDSPKMV